MSNLLRQLESKEAVLLMYLADELPPDDRAEVERMLAGDADGRAELERLREAYDGFAGVMPVLDRATRLPVPESVGVRRVVRDMRQWQARRLARPAAAAPLATLRYPWWAYPLAAAASIVIAFLVWWGHADSPDRLAEVANGKPGLYSIPPAAVPPDFDVAYAWQMGSLTEEPDDVSSLFDASDYAVLLMIDDSEAGFTPPKHNGANPADPALDDDDYL